MKTFSIVLPDNFDSHEYRKQISFISNHIQSYEIKNNKLTIVCDDSEDVEIIEEKVRKSIIDMQFVGEKTEYLYRKKEKPEYYNMEQIFGDKIVQMDEGMIALENDAVYLYQYFDYAFGKMARELGAVEERYPVLLNIHTMIKTGYFRSSPQYSIFCSNPIEDIEQLTRMNNQSFCENEIASILAKPRYTLSPSACFHSYEKYKNRTLNHPMMITFNQSVFRNEGRLNWDDFGRLRDYHVREIVFFGDDQYVENERRKMLNKVILFLDELGIDSYIATAADPFIMPKMQKIKSLQMQQRSKYELQLYYAQNSSLAAASFNLHGTSFTDPFKIKISGVEQAVTGCIGFGIERWILGFLAQYGNDANNWPEAVVKYIKEKKNES